jgi:hypothetical protein
MAIIAWGTIQFMDVWKDLEKGKSFYWLCVIMCDRLWQVLGSERKSGCIFETIQESAFSDVPQWWEKRRTSDFVHKREHFIVVKFEKLWTVEQIALNNITVLTYLRSWALLENLTIMQSFKITFQNFMEPEGSSPCSREPSTGPYPEPDRSSLYRPILSP